MLKLTAALLALTAVPAIAQPLTVAEQAKVDEIVIRDLAADEVPSAEIAIVRDGKLVYAKSYGKASPTLAARNGLPYQIASNSKQFTAMAILLLEDEGKLSLNDPVSKWVPGITDGDKITIRQLLSHTSGLEDYWPQDYSFAAMAHPTTPQAIVDRWAKKPLDFQPGDQWQYSNTGYVVAGMIVEKASGEPLLTFLKQHIFQPLGMTTAMDQDNAVGPAYPVGYGRNALGPVRPVTVPGRGWLYAAGELSMSAEDLAKWDIARMDRSLVPADDWATQETTIKLNNGKDSGYGLGVFVRDNDGQKVVTHTGEAVGFLSSNTVYPKEKAAIVVLTNSWSGGAYSRIARDLAAVVLPQAPKDAVVTAQAVRARAVYDELRAGKLDRSQLTVDANYYFTPQTIADFHSSLAPLGQPTGFDPVGDPVLRGGFVIQGYRISYPSRTLNLSTFYEPGANGRIEQFLVTPGR